MTAIPEDVGPYFNTLLTRQRTRFTVEVPGEKCTHCGKVIPQAGDPGADEAAIAWRANLIDQLEILEAAAETEIRQRTEVTRELVEQASGPQRFVRKLELTLQKKRMTDFEAGPFASSFARMICSDCIAAILAVGGAPIVGVLGQCGEA